VLSVYTGAVSVAVLAVTTQIISSRTC